MNELSVQPASEVYLLRKRDLSHQATLRSSPHAHMPITGALL